MVNNRVSVNIQPGNQSNNEGIGNPLNSGYARTIRSMIAVILTMIQIPLQAQHAESTEQDTVVETRLHALSGFRGNVKNSYSGYNLLLPVAGTGLTWLLASGDADYEVHSYFNKHHQVDNWFFPVYFTGSLGPFALAAYLYQSGKNKSDYRTSVAGMAVFQAACISVLSTTALKFLSGRPYPDFENHRDMKKLSRTFHIGFGKEGIFWGWPSGHTSVTMATVTALSGFYPEKTWIKIAGYSYVLYTIVGVSALHDGSMHWFSDAVAAAFIGYAIGSTVGNYYRSRITADRPRWRFFPSLSQRFVGIRLACHF